MNTTTINIKIDTKLKDEASALADEFGMSLGTMIKVLVRQTVRKKHLAIDTREEQFPPEQMTPQMEKIIAEVDADIRAGRTEGPFTPQEFIAELRKVTDEQRRAQKNR